MIFLTQLSQMLSHWRRNVGGDVFEVERLVHKTTKGVCDTEQNLICDGFLAFLFIFTGQDII